MITSDLNKVAVAHSIKQCKYGLILQELTVEFANGPATIVTTNPNVHPLPAIIRRSTRKIIIYQPYSFGYPNEMLRLALFVTTTLPGW